MLHLLYVIAFTILAVLAMGNLIRNLVTLGFEQRQRPAFAGNGDPNRRRSIPAHPEMFDAEGKVITEPLLVMRSLSMDDARSQLDAIFDASPGGSADPREDA
jgi:hypothetical protein